MDKRRINGIRQNIERIYNTRITGLDWFQVFERGTGAPITGLGNPKRNLDVNRICRHSGQLIYLADQLLKSTGSGETEEIVIVGENQRLFIFPYKNLAIEVVANEKIGDVCFHSTWQVNNTELSVKPFLDVLLHDDFVYAPQEIYKKQVKHKASPKYSEFLEHAHPLFDKAQLMLVINDEEGIYSIGPDQTSNPEKGNIVGFVGLVSSLASDVVRMLQEMDCDLGRIKEVIIGREGYRERGEGGLSVVINYDPESEGRPYLTVFSSSPLGKTLFSGRRIQPGLSVFLNQPAQLDGLVFDYQKVGNVFKTNSRRLRKPHLSQITYDEEKLIWQSFAQSDDIDSLETPDVLGALFDAAYGLASRLPHVLGGIRTIEIKTSSPKRNTAENSTWVLAAPINSSLACLVIASDLQDTIRTIVTEIGTELQKYLGSSLDLEDRRLALEFPETDNREVSDPFSLHRAMISFDSTPFEMSEVEAIIEPVEKDDSTGIQGSLRGFVFSFIDRARILVEFILKKHRDQWSVSIRGTKGSLFCSVHPNGDQFTVFAGLAAEEKLGRVVTWVNKYADEWAPEGDEEDAAISAALTKISDNLKSGSCIFFFGPEISSAVGLPTPRMLAQMLAKKIKATDREDHLDEMSDLYESRFSRKDLIQFLVAKVKLSGREDYKKLGIPAKSLPVSLFVTSNYDKVLEKIIEGTDKPPKILHPGNVSELTEKNQMKVLKLFGDPDISKSEELVITSNDINGFRGKFPDLANGLSVILKEKSIVFLGCDPKDINFKHADLILRGSEAKYPMSAFLITPKTVGLQTTLFWREKGVQIVRLSNKEFFDRLIDEMGKGDYGAFVASVTMLLFLHQ